MSNDDTGTFTYENGATVTFKKFKAKSGLHSMLPSTNVYVPPYRGKEQYNYVHMREEDYKLLTKYYPRQGDKDTALKDKVFVGILASKTECGMPQGLYIPMAWDPTNRRLKFLSEGLTNTEWIYDEAAMNPKTLAKLKASKGEDIEA